MHSTFLTLLAPALISANPVGPGDGPRSNPKPPSSGGGIRDGELGARIGDALIPLGIGDAAVDLFSDGDCKNKLRSIVVRKNSCWTDSPVGWSSMKVTDMQAFKIGGTITSYTKNNCGCPTCGSHGYSLSDAAKGKGCLKDFGFTANAVGVGGY